MGRPATCEPSLRRDSSYYALMPFSLWTMTSPSVTFGGFWRIRSSFSSRTDSDATRVESSACVEVSMVRLRFSVDIGFGC